MDSPLQLQVIAGLIATAVTCMWWWIKTTTTRSRGMNKHREAPQPPGALPLIGHLHLLITKKGESPSRALAAMADRHGPVFMLRQGIRRVLVVSSCAAARECLAANDRALASRPRTAAAKHMGYDHVALGFAPYGPYWRSVRKLSIVHLLSNARVAAFERVRSAEISACMKEAYELWETKGRTPVAVDLKRVFKDLAFGIAVRAVAGKRWRPGGEGDTDEVKRLRRAMDDFVRLLAAFVPCDFFPFLGWLDLGGHQKAMKAAAGDMDAAIAGWLEEHRRRRSAGVPEQGDGDFMDALLSAVEGPEFSQMDADIVVKATCLSALLAGNDSTTVSLIRNVGMLLENPQVLRKAREELDLHVGRQRNVEEADVKNLAYLHAVVKETFRLHPTAEFLLPHQATEDCLVSGFHVPAGTRVLTNVWKLQRDPAAWLDPEAYVPERFLQGSHAHVDVRGRQFELIPFGAGRRMCPGISFALHVVHLTLARLIHGFELRYLPAAGSTASHPDLGETLLLLSPTTPFEVVLSPRLPSELYA